MKLIIQILSEIRPEIGREQFGFVKDIVGRNEIYDQNAA